MSLHREIVFYEVLHAVPAKSVRACARVIVCISQTSIQTEIAIIMGAGNYIINRKQKLWALQGLWFLLEVETGICGAFPEISILYSI